MSNPFTNVTREFNLKIKTQFPIDLKFKKRILNLTEQFKNLLKSP